jgi:MFS family permease
MGSSGSMRAQIGTLIIATSGVQLANGFFDTLISLRVAIESFEATMAGLVLSSYFAGFTLAALRCGPIIERVGHIRAYAAFAGMVVAATATMRCCSDRCPGWSCGRSSASAAPGSSSQPRAGSTQRPSRRSAGGSFRSTWSARSSPSRWDSS